MFTCLEVVYLFVYLIALLHMLCMQERVEVNMISDALVLREMYRELVLIVTPELKLNEDSAWHPGHKEVEFASMLR